MSGVMKKIADETNGTSFKTYKYSFDSVDVPSFDYDDNQEITWERIGETVRKYCKNEGVINCVNR